MDIENRESKKVFIEGGHRRKTVYKTSCSQCGSEVWRVAYELQRSRDKYCSRECLGKHRTRHVITNCGQCGKEIRRARRSIKQSKSGKCFCSSSCSAKYHNSRRGGHTTYRMVAKVKFGEQLACTRCGYNEFQCSVFIHHIDGDRENCKPDNLVPLCANCHRALHRESWVL